MHANGKVVYMMPTIDSNTMALLSRQVAPSDQRAMLVTVNNNLIVFGQASAHILDPIRHRSTTVTLPFPIFAQLTSPID